MVFQMAGTQVIPFAVADVWRQHYAKPSGFRHWPCEELVRAVGGKRFGTVMEVGCGNGANLWYLAEHADLVVGVDVCREALDAAETYMSRRGAHNVELMHGDITNMQPGEPDLKFDAVVDIMTSQHIPWSRHAALYHAYRRVMKDGAWLFIYTLGRGTTVTGAKQLETFTYDQLPALFPGVSPVCLPQGPALSAALCAAGFHPSPVRQLSRSYGNGAETTYLIAEAKAV